MENQNSIRVLRHRVLVFTVPVRKKCLDSPILIPTGIRGAFTTQQDAWIVTVGEKVTSEVKDFPIGTQVILHDGFELEPTDLDLWHLYRDDARFAGLKAFAESCHGEVHTQLCLDDAILAVHE